MCIALVELGVDVTCVVLAHSDGESSDAARRGVTLISPKAVGMTDPNAILSYHLQLNDATPPDVIIGHGRITGPAALAQKSRYRSAQLVHCFHMSPEQIEPLKEKKDRWVAVDEREETEQKLMEKSDLVVAVGPNLVREAKRMTNFLENPPRVLEWIPGVDPPKQRTFIDQLRVLSVGRAEDFSLKGVDIAARAVEKVSIEHRSVLGDEVRFVVRGIPPGEEDSTEERLKGICPNLHLTLKRYHSDSEEIARDFSETSLVVMPSRAEGFGLVAPEAISYGVPVLVSSESGFGQWLE